MVVCASLDGMSSSGMDRNKNNGSVNAPHSIKNTETVIVKLASIMGNVKLRAGLNVGGERIPEWSKDETQKGERLDA